jgi:predicted enzyme related to lactoylglutathione lyase
VESNVVQLAQVGQVATHRALVDAQAVGQLAQGPDAGAGLQQLQQGEHAGGRAGHAQMLPRTGRILPGTGSSVVLMTSTTPPSTSLPRLLSVRLITDDVARLVTFYEHVTRVPAQWSTPEVAELRTPVGAVAIGGTRTVALFGEGVARPADNHTAIVEFLVTDVDAEASRLRGVLDVAVGEPVTMPWGNRSLLLRDPDGNLVNLFTPVTAQAAARFGV